MNAEIAYRLAGVAGLMLLSAFFSGTETALFSLSRVQLERLRQSSRARDRIITGLLALPRRLITTVLIGNELVNISIATLVATIVDGLLRGVLGPVRLTLVSTVIALPLLVLLCEVTPKSVALRVPERWALAAARPIKLLAVAVAPLRWVVGGIANAVLFLMGQRPKGPGARDLREAEFRALVDAGSREGEVEATEQRLIHNVFEFGDRAVGEIMTPMERMFSLPYDWSLARILDAVQKNRFSRIPIYRRARDNIVGVLLAKDLVVMARGHGAPRALGELLLPAYYVPKGTKCDFLFRQMQRRKTHIAIVVNEYGRTIGLCTMEDLLEEVFGEIMDEKEAPPRPAGDGDGTGAPAAAPPGESPDGSTP
ncbi:MAG TPA: hemolysin family protein [Polyangia bacterium]|jgi:putative hemolysin